jgi:hypothetical protein
MRVVDRLGSLQFDPLEVTGRNHDLVLAARIDGYQRAWTDDLLYGSRTLYETYNKGLSIVPTRELPWYRVAWDLSHADHTGAAFDEHAPLVEELVERIRADGPLSSTDVAPRAAIDWYWRPTNQVRAILEALAEAGILGLARREECDAPRGLPVVAVGRCQGGRGRLLEDDGLLGQDEAVAADPLDGDRHEGTGLDEVGEQVGAGRHVGSLRLAAGVCHAGPDLGTPRAPEEAVRPVA